jgi:hypothetical protein
VTGWQRTERWLALFSFVASVAAFLGWVGAVGTGSGGLAALLLLLVSATVVFDLVWVLRPRSLRWWSGLLVLVVAIGPACYAFLTLTGTLPHVAGLLTIVASALTGTTVFRRYEMPPVGK